MKDLLFKLLCSKFPEQFSKLKESIRRETIDEVTQSIIQEVENDHLEEKRNIDIDYYRQFINKPVICVIKGQGNPIIGIGLDVNTNYDNDISLNVLNYAATGIKRAEEGIVKVHGNVYPYYEELFDAIFSMEPEEMALLSYPRSNNSIDLLIEKDERIYTQEQIRTIIDENGFFSDIKMMNKL